MLTYIRNLGSNESLTLQQLTLKLVILIALTRPSHSTDLSQLDIKHQSFSAEGVPPTYQSVQTVFKPTADLSSHPFGQTSIYVQYPR